MKYVYGKKPGIAKKDKIQLIIIWGLVFISAILAIWLWDCWTRPINRQDVSNSVVHAEALTNSSSVENGVVYKPQLVSNQTEETVPTNSRIIPSGVDEYGTPYPEVEAVKSRTHHRPDGFDNMCFYQNGFYGVAVLKDYDPNDGWWPYLGEIDPSTQSAANAKESENWCKANQP